MYILIADQISL